MWYHSAIVRVSEAIIPLVHAHYRVGGVHNDSVVRNDSVVVVHYDYSQQLVTTL